MHQPAIESGDLVILHCATGAFYGHVWFYGAGEHPLATQSMSIIELIPSELRLPALEGAANTPVQRPPSPMLLTTQVLAQIMLYSKAGSETGLLSEPDSKIILQ